MTTQEIRYIFSRFQNLNLLTLIEDLRRDQVASHGWIMPRPLPYDVLCPLGHGWVKLVWMSRVASAQTYHQRAMASAGFIGRDVEAAQSFIRWWDASQIKDTAVESRFRLILILESFFRERLEDADAVQAVISQETVQEHLIPATGELITC